MTHKVNNHAPGGTGKDTDNDALEMDKKTCMHLKSCCRAYLYGLRNYLAQSDVPPQIVEHMIETINGTLSLIEWVE